MDFWKILETDLLEIQRTELIFQKLDSAPVLLRSSRRFSSDGGSAWALPSGWGQISTVHRIPEMPDQWVNSCTHPAGSGSLRCCYRLAYMGTEGSRYLYIYIYINTQYTYMIIWSHMYIHILYVYRYYGYTVFRMLNNPPSKYNHDLQSLATCPSILSISRSYLLTTTGVFPCHPMSLCLCTVLQCKHLRACICSRACISSRACCKYCQDCSLEKPWESVMALRMGPQRSPHHYSKWL